MEKQPLQAITLDFPVGLCVVCGVNGVGKSTFLRMIEGVLNGSATLEGRCRPELIADGLAELDMSIAGKAATVVMDSEPKPPTEAVLLDAFDNCARVLALVGDPNFADLFEGVEPSAWTGAELSLANYVIGREYDTIDVFEIEIPTPLDSGFAAETVAFFRVSSRGVPYDSLAMGLGELAALFALWRLWAVEPNTVVMLEEPETFLSSRSTVAFMDVLARQVDTKSVYAIVTTHSADVVARVPIENVVLLHQALANSDVVLRTQITRAELEHALGVFVGQSRLVVTEDKMARMFARELLSRHGVWGQAIEVTDAGGVAAVVSLCRTMPKSDRLRLVGVLDGDQRTTPPAAPLNWPVVMLPGHEDPNTVLKNAACALPGGLADGLGRASEDVAAAVQTCAGVDGHDWFPDLAAALNVDENAIVRAAIHCWLSTEAGRQAAELFTSEVVDALRA